MKFKKIGIEKSTLILKKRHMASKTYPYYLKNIPIMAYAGIFHLVLKNIPIYAVSMVEHEDTYA